MTRAQFKMEKKNRRHKHFKQIIRSGIPLVFCILIFLLVFIGIILILPKSQSDREDMKVDWEIVPAKEPIKIITFAPKSEVEPVTKIKMEPVITEVKVEIEPELELEPEPELIYLGTYWITGYDTCEYCCGKTDGITASGTYATVGRTIAASYDIPFGTVLYIDGIGERVVEDRGGAIYDYRIDVLCADHDECYAITGWYDVWMVQDKF